MTEKAERHAHFDSRGSSFTFEVDGETVMAYEGETILTALLAAGYKVLRRRPDGSPAGAYCGIGICFDCAVSVDDAPTVRSCMTLAAPGTRVRTALFIEPGQ